MSDIDVYKTLYPNLRLIHNEILSCYHICSEADAWQLHRLHEILGSEIIAKAAIRQLERWPGQPLFVSTLRKRCRNRLPRDFYGSRLQEWGVYLLVALNHSCTKIGLSSNVLHRAFVLSGNNPNQTRPVNIRFDMNNSFVILGFESKATAAAAEKELKEKTANAFTPPPDWAPYMSAKTEWRLYNTKVTDAFQQIAEDSSRLRIVKASLAPVQMSMLELLA